MEESTVNKLINFVVKAAKFILILAWKMFKGTVVAGVMLGLGAIGFGRD